MMLDDVKIIPPESPSSEELDLSNMVTNIHLIATPELKKLLEMALVKHLKDISSKTFSNVIVLLGGRKSEIEYFSILYKQSLQPAPARRRGGFFIG